MAAASTRTTTMNKVAIAVVVLSSSSFAADISGTFSATFDSFNEFGLAQVDVNLTLQCGLTCPMSAPELRYGLSDGANIYFASQRDEKTGYLGSGFGTAPSGVTSIKTTTVSAGSAVVFVAEGANCWCGNRALESGYIDLEAATLAVPPWVVVPTSSKETFEDFLLINGKPRGSETIVVQLSGTGLSQTTTLDKDDFNSNGIAMIRFTPPQAGAAQVIATFQPYGVARVASFTVASNGSSGGGGGGATGGGDGSGGGTEEQPSGCASTPGLVAVLALLGLIRRRAASA